LALVAVALLGCAVNVTAQDISPNADAFMNPPISARPGAFWAWLEGHVSLDRITYELEEMKAKGMAGADIWDVHAYINPDQMIPAGPTFLGETSLKAVAHALREAKRLGLRLGMIAASGWNAGGTWVEPADAGMGLFHAQVTVQGPTAFSQALPFPEVPKACPKGTDGRPLFSREVAVLAVPQQDDQILASTDAVLNVTEFMNPDGRLTWDVPAGRWTILRFIMSNTGYQLIAQSPNSGGPMIDFLNPESTRMHFGHIIERLESVLGDISDFPLDHLEVDSMELGHHTIWTGQIIQRFKKAYGYDPLPYLPLLKGWKTKDAHIRQRFLYDWKKLVSDVFIDNHYRTGSAFLRQHGVKLCAEAGGPGAPIWDSCPVDALKALGAVDILRGEFWPKMRNIWLVKEISSAAHIYGKTIVDAESFTSWRHLQDGPYFFKLMADKAMAEGLNHFTFHTFAHSPAEAGLPGSYYHAGTHINPNRVWWPMAGPFIEYLSRCCYMLQQGLFVADVCYYYGDQAPNFVAAKGVDFDPGIGYDYDVVNTDVILKRMSVRNERLVLPDGMSYAALVLPEQEHMDLDVLQKLESLIKAGATVIGPKPSRTQTLMGYPKRDQKITRLANRMWNTCDGKTVRTGSYGKGRVVWNRPVAEVLQEQGIGPDFQYAGSDARTQLDYVHRRTTKEDIYFVVNLNERWESVECAFRVQGKRPQLWHPETGQLRDIPAYDMRNDSTRLTLHLKPAESVFVVFREPATPHHLARVEPLARPAADTPRAFAPHSATPGGPMWLSDGRGEVADQYISFDLGAPQHIEKIRVWNYIESVRGFMNYGIKDMEILASQKGTDYQTVGAFSLQEASQVEDKHYHQDLDVDIDKARYVRFDVKTNHSTTHYSNGVSKHVGLCRVKFFGDQDIAGVKIHAVSSGVAFDPASDDNVGPARPAAELRLDPSNRPYLRVWSPGTYALHHTRTRTEKIEVLSVPGPLEIDGPWQVSFAPGWGAPERKTFATLMSWSDSEDDGIKYFSGRATYSKTFDMPQGRLEKKAHLELDLGVVHKVARVLLNEREIAVLWKPPFCVDITDAVKPGKNDLTVEVANTWTNRLIGDAYLPAEKQYCKTNLHARLSRKDRPLQPSGLLGPVKIHTAVHLYSQDSKALVQTMEDARKEAPKKTHFDPVIKDIEGWTVDIDPKMLEGEHAEAGGRALTMLANHLQRIAILMPEDRLKEMRTLGIWIEHDHPDINVEPGPYHPGVGWLTERGYDPRLAKKVHVTRAASLLERHHMLKHPAVILHELAHAYHHQILGFDEPRIKAAYDQAMEAGLYNDVLLYTGRTVRHYAANNHLEYFAEGTEVYFYRNDFYPFVRAELKQYDPRLHELLKEIWGPME